MDGCKNITAKLEESLDEVAEIVAFSFTANLDPSGEAVLAIILEKIWFLMNVLDPTQ